MLTKGVDWHIFNIKLSAFEISNLIFLISTIETFFLQLLRNTAYLALFYNLESLFYNLASTNIFCNLKKKTQSYLDNRRSRLVKTQLVLKDKKTIKDMTNRNASISPYLFMSYVHPVTIRGHFTWDTK